MSIEQQHGAARPTLPHSSDLTAFEAERDRTEGRDGAGRFVKGNPFAPGAKWRSLIAEGLGRELDGQAGAIGRRAFRLFRSFLADLPCDCASVRSLVAQRARAVALADAYAQRGAELGIASAEGAAAFSEAHKWCQRAERLAVTSWDISVRAAKAASKGRVIDAHAEAAAAFGDDPGEEQHP